MRFRSITLELLRQQRRVRKAEEQVWRDQFETALVWRRLVDESRAAVASPQGLATSMAAGFVFDRIRNPPVQARGSLQQQILGAIHFAVRINRWLKMV